MIDLTKITTPFGLLDEDTQAALKAHGGPYEVWCDDIWKASPIPAWKGSSTYRVMPAPPKPREFWVATHKILGKQVFENKPRFAKEDGFEVIRVREVL